MTIAEKLEQVNEKIPQIYEYGYIQGEIVGYDCGYMDGEGDGWSNGWDDGYMEGEEYGYTAGYEYGWDDGYSQGHETGYAEGWEFGLEDGKSQGYDEGYQTHYDEFWDVFQQNGNRQYYLRAFAGYGWNSQNFYPKYDLILEANESASQMFYNWAKQEGEFDLAQRLEECGVILDISKANYVDRMFAYGRWIRLPVVDLTGIVPNNGNAATYIFGYCRFLETIDAVVVNENVKPSYWFEECFELKNLTIEGKLAQNGFDVSSCSQLTKESILSIVQALSLDITETKTITLSTAHKDLIEGEMPDGNPDADGNPSVEFLIWAIANDAKMAGWSFVYA